MSCLETRAAVSGDLGVTAPHVRPGLRQPADLRCRSRRAAAADAGFSGRLAAPIREDAVVPLEDTLAGLRLPHPRRAACSAWRRRAQSRPDHARDHVRREGLQSLVLRPADLARPRRSARSISARAGENFFTRRGPAVLHAGGRAGGHRARQRALLQAHRGAQRAPGGGEGLPGGRDPHRQPLRGDRRPEPRAASHSEAGGDGGAHRFHGA